MSDVEVIEMSHEEWEAAKARALESVGLTYEELADQARRRDFSSWRAQKVWLTFGGEEDFCHCGEPVIHDSCYDPERGWYGRGMCANCDAVRCDAYPGACREPA